MTDDFAELERIAGALVARMSSADRRQLLLKMARELRRSQSDRIAAQRNPEGSPFAARKPKKDPTPGNYAVKFLYPKGAAEPRLVLMKSWVRQGPLLTGYDMEAGGIRSFFWDRVDRWLPVEQADQNKNAGKLRRRGHIRRQAMFRKLRSSRFLKAGASDTELWVGFTGRASAVARIHQDGLEDRPNIHAKPVRYPRREVIGPSEADRTMMLDLLLASIDVYNT